MLHAKMMMDPVISLVLFNEYIPLRQPNNKKNVDECEDVCKDMNGLFLGKLEDEPVNKTEENIGGLFIRSELPIETAVSASTSASVAGGLFIRSEDTSASTSASPQCSTDDWVIA